MEQASALGDGAIPQALLERPGITATSEEIGRSLERLAADPPDDVPDDWAEWLSWLAFAAASGGARSRSASPPAGAEE
jgi:hypothetical protein